MDNYIEIKYQLAIFPVAFPPIVSEVRLQHSTATKEWEGVHKEMQTSLVGTHKTFYRNKKRRHFAFSSY
jgi:hypothetical protein